MSHAQSCVSQTPRRPGQPRILQLVRTKPPKQPQRLHEQEDLRVWSCQKYDLGKSLQQGMLAKTAASASKHKLSLGFYGFCVDKPH